MTLEEKVICETAELCKKFVFHNCKGHPLYNYGVVNELMCLDIRIYEPDKFLKILREN